MSGVRGDLRDYFGFGVAGNFAGHLEQAGEAADFVGVGDAVAEAPKGIFPFYVPGSATFLGDFPLAHDRIAKPQSSTPVNLQIEPEAGLACELEYRADGSVSALRPFALAAFNDCSIRRPNAKKISEKKNWGANSKGVAASMIEVEDLESDQLVQRLRLACFLQRDGKTQAYGIDSPVTGYSYFGSRLVDWLVDRLNHQSGDQASPLESMRDLLELAGRPAHALIGVGATRYTAVGESTYLQAGDQSIVVIYDGGAHSAEETERLIAAGEDHALAGASILRQTVYDLSP